MVFSAASHGCAKTSWNLEKNSFYPPASAAVLHQLPETIGVSCGDLFGKRLRAVSIFCIDIQFMSIPNADGRKRKAPFFICQICYIPPATPGIR